MKKLLWVAFIALLGNDLTGQSNSIQPELTSSLSIEWQSPTTFENFDGTEIILLQFEGAHYNLVDNKLPFIVQSNYLPSNTDSAVIEFDIKAAIPIGIEEAKALINVNIPEKVVPSVQISWYRKRPIAIVNINPIYRDAVSGEVMKITEIQYKLVPIQTSNSARSANWNFKTNSVLRQGNWVKVGVTTNGVHRINYSDMQSMGFDLTNLASNNIRLFGNGGGKLPFDNSAERFDDLEENAIEINDGGDGVFNNGDFLLFYGQNQIQWTYSNSQFIHTQNIFSDTTYYFITTDYLIGSPKRISKKSAPNGGADVAVNTFSDYDFHEVDLINFVKSGRNWYGESFNFTKEQSFPFSFPNMVQSSGHIKSRAAFRVIGRSGQFTYNVNGTTILTTSHGGVTGGYYDAYAGIVANTNDFSSTSGNFNVDVIFNNPSTADNAWLDYIEISCLRNLIFTGNQMTFRNTESITANIIQYNFSNLQNERIWDVTTPTNTHEVTRTGNNFKSIGGQLNEYIAFNGASYITPVNFGKVQNQDLHAIQQADYIIVTHPKFIAQATQLANYHIQNSGLKTVVVTTNQLYNEYSSGSQDITAIRSFIKMLYDRAGSDNDKIPKYVLLFGDASYDYKDRISGNTNYVPAYQSWDSESPLNSYVSDDFVGFLDDQESDALSSSLDVGIGRIMAQSTTQAQDVVNKTIHYMSQPVTLRPWRNWVTFVGDDEDGKEHMRQSDELAQKIDTTYPNYNINKIYLDAYQQVSNAGGSTYPDVNIALDKATEKGSTIITYIGHGGELGLAHERILGLSQINNYSNFDALALYLTATCEFSRFDDPERTSAGEQTLLNPNGGALALLTTTRLVYSRPNFILTQKFYNVAFEKINGEWPRLGDLLRLSKINGNDINTRNFSLLGDPAAQLAYPEYNVITTSIPDTIKSLQKITISGYVTDAFNNKNTQFNGTVYPSVFGQRKTQSTLNNDGQGVFQFETQTSLIYNGKISVTNGEFTFSFIVPKDIDFNYGKGKISYYAENTQIDASGAYEDFYIGGRDGDPDADNTPPTISLWMNDESFVMGGITDENPLLYAKVFDESGINTVGNGIGHDIVAVIDENTANSIVLNDYYESDLNSYQKGSVSYDLTNLSEGKHTLRLKVWDVYNNSAEAYTEFYVSNSSDFSIEHVLNYPNPFTTNTDFYFDHNAIGQQIDVRVQIFTISGKLVKTIDYIEQAESYKVGPINWDGKDDYGDRIGKGTYIYKVKATNSFGQTVEKFEKIVIL